MCPFDYTEDLSLIHIYGLVDWIKAFEVKPQKVFVTHGEDTVTELFAARLRDEMNYDAYAPFSGTEFDLAEGEFLYEAEGVKIQKPAALQKASKAAKVYEKLLDVYKRQLKCRVQGVDGQFMVCYDITSKQSLLSLYEEKKMGYEDLQMILGGFVQVMEEMSEYLLNPCRLVLKPEYMYCLLYTSRCV